MGVFARAFAVLVVAVLLQPPGAAAGTRHAVPLDDSPAVGAPGAPVVIVEFIDYQ